MNDTVYTRAEAALIVELFESLLDYYEISLPSQEDDERDAETSAKIYGSTYSKLLAEVENMLIGITERTSAGAKIVKHVFN